MTRDQKTNYWNILYNNAYDVAGSACLGQKGRQHIGVVIGKPNTSDAKSILLKYASADSVSTQPADLFDAVYHAHVLRMAWKTEIGYYVELWSAYPGVDTAYSDQDRARFLKFLDTLSVEKTSVSLSP